MKSVRLLALGAVLAGASACEDETLRSRGGPSEPPVPAQGVQAFLQVDNDQAAAGERVQVYVRLQLGSETQFRVGSYAGRLRFDPQALQWNRDVEVNDGLRVVNPGDAGAGTIRFAGASAGGFGDPVLYHGEFTVRRSGYAAGLGFELDELAAAQTLADLGKQLQVAPRVFRADAP